MEQKLYKITLVFDDGSNCRTVRPGNDAKTVLAEFLQAPSVRKHQLEHPVVDFKVEELDKPPIPPEDRFWLERRDDGVYVVIDEQRKRALTFEFGRLRDTARYTDFHGEKPSLGVINSEFLMEVHFWLSKYYPALLG